MQRRLFLAGLPLLRLQAKNRVDVIAHRGEHIECPENTMPAIEKAIALGVDWVEIDVRTTKDGKFVLMHDAGVERATGAQGQIADLTFDELRALDASHHKPGFKNTRIPTLDEALAAMRGKCGVYFDAKRIAADSILAALKRHDMLERAVVYGGFNLLKDLTAQGHPALAMPEAVSVEVSQRILAELNVRVIAFDARDFKPDVIAVARQAKKGIFVDRLGPADTEEKWREAIALGATGIQTDHPEQLIKIRAAAPTAAPAAD